MRCSSLHLGSWNFSNAGNDPSAIFTYPSTTAPAATETLTRVAQTPEPGTALLPAAGRFAMALGTAAKV